MSQSIIPFNITLAGNLGRLKTSCHFWTYFELVILTARASIIYSGVHALRPTRISCSIAPSLRDPSLVLFLYKRPYGVQFHDMSLKSTSSFVNKRSLFSKDVVFLAKSIIIINQAQKEVWNPSTSGEYSDKTRSPFLSTQSLFLPALIISLAVLHSPRSIFVCLSPRSLIKFSDFLFS